MRKRFFGRSNLKNNVPVQQFACSFSFVVNGTFFDRVGMFCRRFDSNVENYAPTTGKVKVVAFQPDFIIARCLMFFFGNSWLRLTFFIPLPISKDHNNHCLRL